MPPKIKAKIQDQWPLLLAAFFGGICLSLSELMQMLTAHEGLDLYFFGGMFVAGLMGIGAFILAGADKIKTAFTSGVAAPQLLGGLVKAGTAGVKAASVFAISTVYAQGVDSTKVNIQLNGVEQEVMLQSLDGRQSYPVSDSCVIVVPNQDSMVIVGVGFVPQKVKVNYGNDTQLKISIEPSKNGFVRGLFAQQFKESKLEKFRVEAVKKFDKVKSEKK